MSPLLLSIACLQLVLTGHPVLFWQLRSGRGERLFRVVKFRTLQPDSESPTGRFGTFLRISSLDELPQLWNVLRGEMSLVGPRPLLPEYAPLYNDVQRRRFQVKPGLTGLAQVSGRHRNSWTKKFEWDVRYAETVSFGLDIRIVMKTFLTLFRWREASSLGRFTGNN